MRWRAKRQSATVRSRLLPFSEFVFTRDFLFDFENGRDYTPKSPVPTLLRRFHPECLDQFAIRTSIAEIDPVPRQNHRRNNVTAAKLDGRSFGERWWTRGDSNPRPPHCLPFSDYATLHPCGKGFSDHHMQIYSSTLMGGQERERK